MAFFPFRHERSNELRINDWFAGLHISSDCRRIETALIGLQGRGSDSAVVLQKNMSFDLPIEISSSFEDVQRQFMEEPRRLAKWTATSATGTERNQSDEGSDSVRSNQEKTTHSKEGDSILSSDAPPNAGFGKEAESNSKSNQNLLRELESLKIMLTSVEKEAIDELFADSGVDRNDVSLLTVFDPEIWVDTVWGVSRQSLCDSAELALKTGLNVLDALPDKDVAASGHGRPLLPFPYWIFLNQTEQNRILIDLGRTARLTFLPRNDGNDVWKEIRFVDGVPCGALFDYCIRRISRGQSDRDVGGRLSVQGRCIPEFVQLMRQTSLNIEQLSKKDFWSLFLSPVNVVQPYFKLIDETLQTERWSLSDLLCSTVHWLAETIVRRMRQDFSPLENSFEVVVTGNAKQNGLLFNRLATLLQPKRLETLQSLRFPEESFDAMAVAMLGVLYCRKIPMNLPQLTSAEQSLLLGRLTLK